MENKIFNVNGKTKEQLQLAVQLLLLDEYGDKKKITGWYCTEEKGMVITWWFGDKYKATPFTDRMGKPSEIGENELVDFLWNWLNSEEARKVKCEDWAINLKDSDVSNGIGWRLYTDRWGHIEEEGHSLDHYSIAAFKPVYLWLWCGK